MSKVKINKSTQKGARGLAINILELLNDETYFEIGKKKFAKLVAEEAASFTKVERAEALSILSEDPLVAAGKRFACIRSVLIGGTAEATKAAIDDKDTLRKAKEKLCSDAAKIIADKEDKSDAADDGDDGDEVEPRVVLINRDKNPKKEVSTGLAHVVEYGPKIFHSNLLSFKMQFRRKLGWI